MKSCPSCRPKAVGERFKPLTPQLSTKHRCIYNSVRPLLLSSLTPNCLTSQFSHNVALQQALHLRRRPQGQACLDPCMFPLGTKLPVQTLADHIHRSTSTSLSTPTRTSPTTSALPVPSLLSSTPSTMAPRPLSSCPTSAVPTARSTRSTR